MDQPTFADLDYQSKKRKTRWEVSPERMDGLIPWERLEQRIRPVYPRPWPCRRRRDSPQSRGSVVGGHSGGGSGSSCLGNLAQPPEMALEGRSVEIPQESGG